MSKLIIINGPNLNLLGEREQTQYGSKDYKHLKEICLNRAKDLIDILDTLKEKTSGNLTNDESKVMEETLSNLKMLYVKATSSNDETK